MKFEQKPIEKFYNIECDLTQTPETIIEIENIEDTNNIKELILPSGVKIINDDKQYLYVTDGVKTDLEACEKLFKLYPHFVFCNGELYVFDFESGMLNNSKTAHLNIIKAHSDYLHLMRYDKNDGSWNKLLSSYGYTVSLMKKLIPLLKTMNMDDNWLNQHQTSSLGKILFNNGYYDFKKGLFYSKEKYGYNPEILFIGKIPHDFTYLCDEDIDYMNTIKTRLFHNPLGIELGDYLLLNLARGLSGELMKRFLFGLGGTNGGKSVLTDALKLSCGDYVGIFNAENLAYRQSSADEAAQLRWALLLRFKRLIISNEVKTGDGEKEIALNGNMIKKLSSGGDGIVGRSHCKEETEFIPHFLTLCLANDMVKIKPYDDAVNNRLKILKFDKTFVDNPSNEFELKKDENIKDELKTERFQRCFVMLLIEYYADWNDLKQIEGYVETEPEIVKIGKSEWVEDLEGFLVAFLKDFELTMCETDCVKSSDIEDWLKYSKLGISMTKFGLEFKKYLKINKINTVYNKYKKIGGKTTMHWFGLKRIPNEEDDSHL